ncbi:hypothetical protein B296_00053412 [Ensete ventricosum]|uniref:Uncharacterized protein n=1 Tax=Ensete ventricosum TaxID=4639 RepID=A0A426XEJ3_ENSVE|nr:hypothetical protein B296_00053412 [Ensete ventricosum]
MVCTIPASAWTWLVRSRKASAVTMSGAGFDAGEVNPGSVIILQKQLGVGMAAATSSSSRGWSGSVWRFVPESVSGRSGDMGPHSSAKNDRGESGARLLDEFHLRVWSAVRPLAPPVYSVGYLRRVGHVDGPAVRGCDDLAARLTFVISVCFGLMFWSRVQAELVFGGCINEDFVYCYT